MVARCLRPRTGGSGGLDRLDESLRAEEDTVCRKTRPSANDGQNPSAAEPQRSVLAPVADSVPEQPPGFTHTHSVPGAPGALDGA